MRPAASIVTTASGAASTARASQPGGSGTERSDDRSCLRSGSWASVTARRPSFRRVVATGRGILTSCPARARRSGRGGAPEMERQRPRHPWRARCRTARHRGGSGARGRPVLLTGRNRAVLVVVGPVVRAVAEVRRRVMRMVTRVVTRVVAVAHVAGAVVRAMTGLRDARQREGADGGEGNDRPGDPVTHGGSFRGAVSRGASEKFGWGAM